MKVVLICGSFPPDVGGISDYSNKLFQQLLRDIGQEDVCVVTHACSECTLSDDHVLRTVRKWNPAGVGRTVREVRRLGPDVVHIQYPPSGFKRSLSTTLLPLFLRIFAPRVRVFCTIHEFDNKTLAGKLRLLTSMIFCHGIVVVSEGYRESIARLCPSLIHRMTFIPIGSNIRKIGITTERKQALRENLGWADDDVVMVYFGLLRDGKGIDQLLDGFLTARESCTSLRLLLVGGTGATWDETSFLSMLRDHDVVDSVRLTGRVSEEEASEYLSVADFAGLPFTDGVSTKRTGFVAAVEHNLPIVTTTPSSGMAGLHDGVNVILVPPGDREELANAIVKVASNQELRAMLAENVYTLRRQFSWPMIARAHIALYKDCWGVGKDTRGKTSSNPNT